MDVLFGCGDVVVAWLDHLLLFVVVWGFAVASCPWIVACYSWLSLDFGQKPKLSRSLMQP